MQFSVFSDYSLRLLMHAASRAPERVTIAEVAGAFGISRNHLGKVVHGLIGQTLAMEGMFAFFLEGAMVGAMVWGEKRLGPRNHFLATVGVALGSWLWGYFLLTTNGWQAGSLHIGGGSQGIRGRERRGH